MKKCINKKKKKFILIFFLLQNPNFLSIIFLLFWEKRNLKITRVFDNDWSYIPAFYIVCVLHASHFCECTRKTRIKVEKKRTYILLNSFSKHTLHITLLLYYIYLRKAILAALFLPPPTTIEFFAPQIAKWIKNFTLDVYWIKVY